MRKSIQRAFVGGMAVVTILIFFGLAHSQVTFVEVSQQAGIHQVTPSWGANWVDVNNDGWEDLYTTNHQYYPQYQHVEIPPALFVNNGDGTYTNSTAQYGLISLGDLHGAAWGDYNNDGFQDLFQSTGGGGGGNSLGAANMLYKNLGNGTYGDIAMSAGVDMPNSRGRGGFWFDYDLDSFLDLFICNAERTGYPSELMKNNGNDTFTPAGLSVMDAYIGSPVDYNNDRYVDLFLGTRRGVILYQNNGNGTFLDVTALSGLSGNEYVQAFSWFDYDNDGDMDLFLIRGGAKDAYQQNPAEILFKTSIPGGGEKGIDFSTLGSSVTFDIYDYHWTVDPAKIYIGAQGIHPAAIPFTLTAGAPEAQGKPVYTPGAQTAYYLWEEAGVWHLRGTTISNLGKDFMSGTISSNGQITGTTSVNFEIINYPFSNRLYENLGNGTFAEVSTTAGVADIATNLSAGVSAMSADFDNDGWLDLYIVNTGWLSNAPNALYINNGNKTFAETSLLSGVQANVEGLGENAVAGDYDKNGFLDIFVTNGLGPAPFNYGPHLLFQNQGNANHWLKVKLTGRLSNRDAVGATVIAKVGQTTYVRQQTGGVSRYSQNSGVVHFGIGTITMIDKLTVKWPNGVTQTLVNVAADQTLSLTEPAVNIKMTPLSTIVSPGGKLTYNVVLTNETNRRVTFDLWTHIKSSAGTKYPQKGELIGPMSVTLPPLATVTKAISSSVPSSATSGSFDFLGFVGRYPIVWSNDSFVFTVQ